MLNLCNDQLLSDCKALMLEEVEVFSTPESPEVDIACGRPWWSQSCINLSRWPQPQ